MASQALWQGLQLASVLCAPAENSKFSPLLCPLNEEAQALVFIVYALVPNLPEIGMAVPAGRNDGRDEWEGVCSWRHRHRLFGLPERHEIGGDLGDMSIIK